MCGRFALTPPLSDLADDLDAIDSNDGKWPWEGSYNIAPSAVIPVVALNGQGQRAILPMRWGLHPHWSKTMPEGRPLFNARLETASEKPSFRTPWKRRRALIPFSGWYEWERIETDGKLPHYIQHEEDEVSVFAGLWDHYYVDEGITLLSATILTTAATGPMKHLHHRMPVRLPKNLWKDWLSPETRAENIMRHKLGSDDLHWHAVSRTVNSGHAQGAGLIKPVDI